ncbi:hypothetical protein [Maridesulfovibrio sp.]|uniref:hypothetical protein n=1 Tax=unclassified Maridesulfovibrio TaxID=2794999 RepID=UPI003B007DD4
MKNLLTFIGGVAVGVLAITGIYALDDGHGEACEGVEDLAEVDDGLEELLEPDGS